MEAVGVLERLLQSLQAVIDHGKVAGDWENDLAWLNDVLAEVWTNRGPFPGAGSVIEFLGNRLGTSFHRQVLALKFKAGENAWEYVEAILGGQSKCNEERFAAGMREASTRWNAYRPEILRCAKINLGTRGVNAYQRVDASDLVQQTLIDAVRGLPEFRGQTEPEFTAWIMKILERNLQLCVRNNTLAKRDVRLEHKWVEGSGSAAMMWHSLPGDGPSPTSGVVRGEAALHLAAALDKLPLDQRTAVILRYIDQGSLQAIADQMDRRVGSVAGLIRRGLEALENHLPPELQEHD